MNVWSVLSRLIPPLGRAERWVLDALLEAVPLKEREVLRAQVDLINRVQAEPGERVVNFYHMNWSGVDRDAMPPLGEWKGERVFATVIGPPTAIGGVTRSDVRVDVWFVDGRLFALEGDLPRSAWTGSPVRVEFAAESQAMPSVPDRVRETLAQLPGVDLESTLALGLNVANLSSADERFTSVLPPDYTIIRETVGTVLGQGYSIFGVGRTQVIELDGREALKIGDVEDLGSIVVVSPARNSGHLLIVPYDGSSPSGLPHTIRDALLAVGRGGRSHQA